MTDKKNGETLIGASVVLKENINQSTATPANPVSNISNGALGYFKAHTSEKKVLIVQ